jgi:hypothetical protein
MYQGDNMVDERNKELLDILDFDGIQQYHKWCIEKSKEAYEKMQKYGKCINSWYEEHENGRFNIHQQFFYKDKYFNALFDNGGLRLLYKIDKQGQSFPWELEDKEGEDEELGVL